MTTRARAPISLGIGGFALHRATVDPIVGAEAQWPGEAKTSGRRSQPDALPEDREGDRFDADIATVEHTHLNEKTTMFVVDWCTPTHGLRMIERK